MTTTRSKGDTNTADITHRLMKFAPFGNGLLEKRESTYNNIFVIKEDNQIQLYFSEKNAPTTILSGIMSRIDITKPLRLLGTYTQVMILSLVWQTHPQKIYVIGFGGGRIPLVFHHYFPTTVIDSTEIDPEVVSLAQKYFGINFDERMKISIEDGRLFLERSTTMFDIILVDTYSGSGSHPLSFATEEFYQLCQQRLEAKGVVVTNLIEEDPLFNDKVTTFLQSFDTVFEYPIDGAHILFGSNSNHIDQSELVNRASMLGKKYQFDFPFVEHTTYMKLIKFAGKSTAQAQNDHILSY